MALNKYIGVIPAAGNGRRFLSIDFPKELTLIPWLDSNESNSCCFRMACEFSLNCLSIARIRAAYVVISANKLEIIRVLKNGEEFGINLGYLYQNEANGLPYAIDCAYRFIANNPVALVLPDTIIQPFSALKDMIDLFESTKADVILGIFNTLFPQHLCQVVYDGNNRVKELHDKSSKIKCYNTWGLAAWRPYFNDYLHKYLQIKGGKDTEISLAQVFTSAIEDGLSIDAYPVSRSEFYDIGTVKSLSDVIHRVCMMNRG